MQYRILRQGPNDKAPVEIGTARKPEYVDTTSQYDTPYKYSAVAVKGDRGKSSVQTVPITAVDIFPPKVPAGITALAAANSVEVSWERSPDADLKGYLRLSLSKRWPIRAPGELSQPAHLQRSQCRARQNLPLCSQCGGSKKQRKRQIGGSRSCLLEP